MEKITKFTKNNWKKLAIVSIPFVYGINYIRNEYQTSQHMRNVCQFVSQFSTQKSSKVLVLLNPVANNKKCEKKFQKYCEPVLHMAGCTVDVLKTKYVGHAKSIMEALQQLPDIIVVAGGDGTASEVVTGLLRRNETLCPVLFLPLGEKNKTAFSLMGLESRSAFINNLSHCMLALVHGRIEQRPVIKYELIENDDSKTRKPIYGIIDFSWGLLKDTEIKSGKYWYFGPFKRYVSILIASLNNELNKDIVTDISTTPPCHGCNKCESLLNNNSRFNLSKFVKPANQLKENKLCSTEQSYNIKAKQIDVKCMQNSESVFALNTQIVENILSRFDFFKNMIEENKMQSSTTFDSRTIEVIPILSEHKTYYIDGEAYDARHIKISLLQNSLKYFSC